MKIRSVLEYAAPVFTSMLTESDKSDIERIQKIVFVQLGPGLKSKTKTFDQSRTLNSLWTPPPTTHPKLFFMILDKLQG